MIIWQRNRWLAHLGGFLFAAVCLFFWQTAIARAAASDTVDTVSATVTMENGNLPPLIQKRMALSVATLSEQLLTGHRLADVQAGRLHNEKIIHEVFDKILVGYSVKQVTLIPGINTQVQVVLIPWSDTIQNVQVILSVEGMSAPVESVVRQDFAGGEKVFTENLLGLPVAATDWTNGVLKRGLNAYLAEHLPEFRADFDLLPASTAEVKIVLYPRLPVVRTVDLNMRSNTVPNFTLLNHRQLMQEKVNFMVGVPVAFIARHEAQFQHFLEQTLDGTKDFRAYGMHTQVSLEVGENMVVMSRSDTNRYRLRLEGWTDVGSSKEGHRSTMFRMHTGQMISSKDELFLLTDVYPQDMVWNWSVGYARTTAPGTQLQVRYDIRARRFVVGAEHSLSDRWLLRYEYRWADKMGETALRYKMHDFLSLEYVVDRRDNWLRLIGNF